MVKYLDSSTWCSSCVFLPGSHQTCIQIQNIIWQQRRNQSDVNKLAKVQNLAQLQSFNVTAGKPGIVFVAVFMT